MKITALAPWFGANRIGAGRVGELLAGCEWIGVPFMGGGSELLHLQARTVVANDKHRDVVNLARVLADPVLGPRLYRRLKRLAFHADALSEAQAVLTRTDETQLPADCCDMARAEAYFVACWMGRSAEAGTDGELRGSLPVRWSAGGGDSAVRFRSAVRSLVGFRRVLERVNFTCLDAFEFLDQCKDQPGHGIYCDPPWIGAGDAYRHRFTEADHRRLAERLTEFRATRIVVRYGDHPLIRELYAGWRVESAESRSQANGAVQEVLLTNEPPHDGRLFA